MPSRDLCVDAYVPGERFEPGDLPRRTDLARASPNELAVAWRRQWQPGQELRVRFLDGDPVLHRRVRDHACAWLDHANLGFAFGDHASAEIRVTFTGDGYWSLVGTDALRVGGDEPTMQLGGFDPDADDVVLRRTVLHEFGHAIGCIHEQASPAMRIPWSEEKVYAFYLAWQGWDRATTEANVLRRYSADDVLFSDADPRSIMQYPVPATLTRGGFTVGWNDELSAGDRSFIARIYPGSGGAAPSAPLRPAGGGAAPPSGLPTPAGASTATAERVDRFTASVLQRAEENARQTSRALERGRRLQVLLYVLVFAVGLGTAVAAVVAGLLADSVGQALAGIGIAGLSAASFFAFFLARPLEALERNAIYTQWLAAAVTAYWTRLAYLDDQETVDADIQAATRDLIAELDKLARRHAAATARAPAPADPPS